MANGPWWVEDSEGQGVYSPVSITDISVPPGQTHNWIWNQKGRDFRQVPEGEYTTWLFTWDAGTYTTRFEIKGDRNSVLKDFDTNDNGLIDDSEFFAALDQWVTGQISDQLFFAVLNAWVSQTSASGNAASSPNFVSLAIYAQKDDMAFVMKGLEIARLAVEVFDLNGRRVFVQETEGTRLTWNLKTDSGKPVASGVYLYVVTALRFDGHIVREMKKLVVSR